MLSFHIHRYIAPVPHFDYERNNNPYKPFINDYKHFKHVGIPGPDPKQCREKYTGIKSTVMTAQQRSEHKRKVNKEREQRAQRTQRRRKKKKKSKSKPPQREQMSLDPDPVVINLCSQTPEAEQQPSQAPQQPPTPPRPPTPAQQSRKTRINPPRLAKQKSGYSSSGLTAADYGFETSGNENDSVMNEVNNVKFSWIVM